MSLVEEIKRRNVFRVGIAYTIVGWLLVQIAATVFPILQMPEWTVAFVTMLLVPTLFRLTRSAGRARGGPARRRISGTDRR